VVGEVKVKAGPVAAAGVVKEKVPPVEGLGVSIWGGFCPKPNAVLDV
jgi:hypothetical protein